jgi:hypothetical protein
VVVVVVVVVLPAAVASGIIYSHRLALLD